MSELDKMMPASVRETRRIYLRQEKHPLPWHETDGNVHDFRTMLVVNCGDVELARFIVDKANNDTSKLCTDVEVLRAAVGRVGTGEVRDVLRLLSENEVSTGKAHEWIRDFIKDGKRGPLSTADCPDCGDQMPEGSDCRVSGEMHSGPTQEDNAK